jgi:imidazole glycerol-phosphate synthase subunit HisF
MLRPRLIPVLLVHQRGLVKTKRFTDPKYVGDPLNAVRIFNEKEVDEIIVIDIDATREEREPDYSMIGKLAGECRMPLCYGGGVKSPEQVERIIGLGVEKVAISSAAIADAEMVVESARRVGGQSIVIVLDVKKSGFLAKRYELFTNNGSTATGIHPVDFARRMQELGAGEILLNSIDRDGTGEGYDLPLVDEVRRVVSLPMTILGGAGSLDDVQDLVRHHGVIGAAAGSMFVFKGKYRAVLIQYPSRSEKDRFMSSVSL